MRWLREAGVECAGGRAKRGPRSEMEGMRKKRKDKPFQIKSLSSQVDHVHPLPFG